jgi:hypothetical protein
VTEGIPRRPLTKASSVSPYRVRVESQDKPRAALTVVQSAESIEIRPLSFRGLDLEDTDSMGLWECRRNHAWRWHQPVVIVRTVVRLFTFGHGAAPRGAAGIRSWTGDC